MTGHELTAIFRRNLTVYRREAGLSQVELARAMNTSPGFICDFERGRRSPTLSTIARFATALEIAPASLLSAVGRD